MNQPPVRRLELARARASSASRVQRLGAGRAGAPQKPERVGDDVVPPPTAAQRRQTYMCSRAGIIAPPSSGPPHSGHADSGGYTPCSRSSQNSKYRASRSVGAPSGKRVDDRRPEPVEPLVGVRLGRPLVDQLGEVPDVAERRRVLRMPRDDRQRRPLRLDVIDAAPGRAARARSRRRRRASATRAPR